MSQNKLLAIGECMLELSGQIELGSQAKLNFGGDVLNTALYFARLSGDVSFLTALGDDNFSAQMISHWDTENIDTSKVLKLKTKSLVYTLFKQISKEKEVLLLARASSY